MMYRGRSGISPVVATVILVAIAIVIAIAVAFWATGLVGVFTRFEKLEVTSAFFQQVQGDQRQLVLNVRNTGSADATIDEIFINGIPCQGGCNTNPPIDPDPQNPRTILLTVGSSQQITVGNPPQGVTGGHWRPGVTYEVVVHTASGKNYPVAVLCP
ncbi:MAG: archaellin/type IV pilin N-terminal domain-containing protein [Nitrososphaerota archaeon]